MAVSYTHLDVYKRQALLGAGTVWVVAKAGPALFRAVGSLCRTLFGKVR